MMKIKREHWERMLKSGPCIYTSRMGLIEPPDWDGWLLRGGDVELARTWRARGRYNERARRIYEK